MQLKTVALLLGAIAQVIAQTPPNTLPATNKTVAVTYGSIKVTAGIQLTTRDTATVPTVVFTPRSATQLYSLLLVDLSINKAQVNTSALVPNIQTPLVNGIASNRTTRLHFWQTNITFATNGTLRNTSTPIAYYNPPSPPPGDIAHTYVFYLFEQSPSWSPPPASSPFNIANVNRNSTNRYSFNVSRLAGEPGFGPLVGANYFLVQNTTNSSSSSTTARATGAATATTSRPSGVASASTARPTTTGTGTAGISAFPSNAASSLSGRGGASVEWFGIPVGSQGLASMLFITILAAAGVAWLL